MKLRDRLSNAVYSFMEKRGYIEDIFGRTTRYGQRYVNDSSIMESSDVYELVQDISNQVALATPVVIGPDGNEVKDHHLLKILQRPNDYLTGFEFTKLETNTLLINGETFPLTDRDQLHLAYGVTTKINERLQEEFEMNGQNIPGQMIRHIKNIGTDSLKGAGIIDLARNTLEGVLSAEKVLTDKYTKGGLLAFMLKLDAHINPNNSAQTKIVKAILDQLEGTQNDSDHSVKMIPLGKGYSIETLKSPVDDAAILNYLGVYKKDLGKFLGINVDTYQSLMKTDIEKAMMYLHNKAIKPILKNKSEHYTALFLCQILAIGWNGKSTSWILFLTQQKQILATTSYVLGLQVQIMWQKCLVSLNRTLQKHKLSIFQMTYLGLARKMQQMIPYQRMIKT